MKDKKKPQAALQPSSSKRNRVFGRPWAKGQSGNPSGQRKHAVSLTAALKRVLTRADAEQIAQRLVNDAKKGEPQAVKLLLDRVDGPLNGAMTSAIAIAAAQSETVAPLVPATEVRIVLQPNGRDLPEPQSAPQPAPLPATAAQPEPSEPEGDVSEAPPLPPGVMSGKEFLEL